MSPLFLTTRVQDRRSSSSGLTPVRGKAQLESSLLFDDQHPLLVADSIRPEQGNLEKKMCFDPTVTKAFFRKTPAKLPLIVSFHRTHILICQDAHVLAIAFIVLSTDKHALVLL